MRNASQSILTACHAQYITSRTSVRRKERLAKIYCPDTKKFTAKSVLKIFIFTFLSIPFFCNAQPVKQTTDKKKIILHFKNMVGEKLLQTDSIYKNIFNEPFTVRSFKYYVSNIVLQDDATGKFQSYPTGYFLVDEADSASKQIELTTTLGHISAIHFLLGVDSLKNVSGIQTGNLDPSNGMFWTWNTGYVMAKLEGNSPLAKTPAHAFSYHVGGYKQNQKTERSIRLVLPSLADTKAENYFTINANILTWFSGINNIKIEAVSFCHEPGPLAVMLADNYANMFNITATK